MIAGRVLAQTTAPSALIVGTLSKTALIEGETTMGNLSLSVNNAPVKTQECTLVQTWIWSVSVTTTSGTPVPATSLEATVSPTNASTTNLTVKGKVPGTYNVTVNGSTTWDSSCQPLRKNAPASPKTIVVTVTEAPKAWTIPVKIDLTSATASALPPRPTPITTPEPDPNADPTPTPATPAPTPTPAATPAPTPIESATITTNVGQNIHLTAVANPVGDDTDTWSKTVAGSGTTSGVVSDGPIEIKWKLNNINIANGASAWWMPRNPGTYTILCEADDKWKNQETGVTAPDTGTRNDPVVTKTVTIVAVANPGDSDLGTDPGGSGGGGGNDGGCNGWWQHYDATGQNAPAHWTGGPRMIAPVGGIPYSVLDPVREYRKYYGNCPPNITEGYADVSPTRTDLPPTYNATADRWSKSVRYYAQAWNFSDRSHDFDRTVTAPLPYKWTTPSAIGGGVPVRARIVAAPGASVDAAVSAATDKDTRTVVLQGSSTLVDESLTYAWTSSDGRAATVAFPQGAGSASVKYAAPS